MRAHPTPPRELLGACGRCGARVVTLVVGAGTPLGPNGERATRDEARAAAARVYPDRRIGYVVEPVASPLRSARDLLICDACLADGLAEAGAR